VSARTVASGCSPRCSANFRFSQKSAGASKSGAYIEIISGKLDMPPALAFAHGQLKAMYGDMP
jgi:hypothetical protein